jgi:hypothetical protein
VDAVYQPDSHISASFTIASPVIDSEVLTVAKMDSWMLSDSIFTFTSQWAASSDFPANLTPGYRITFTGGNITSWSISWYKTAGWQVQYIDTYSYFGEASDTASDYFNDAHNYNTPGTWTMIDNNPQHNEIPEPSTLTLLASGMATVGMLRRKRRLSR